MQLAAILNRKGRDVVTIPASEPVIEATRTLSRHGIGAVVVVDEAGRPAGILSERDIVRAVAAEGVAALERRADTLMTRELVTGLPDDTVAATMATMTARRIRHLPVMENGRMAGIVSIGDVVKARLDDAELEVDCLRGLVAGIG